MTDLYRAVLFDLDGTLLNTLEDLSDAVNRVLSKRGFPTREVEAYRRFIGQGSKALIERALPEGRRDEETVRSCLEDFFEDYGRNWNVKTRPYEQVPEMLNALQARGVRMAVLSNKRHEFTLECIAAYFSQWKFDAVLGQRDGTRPKPDPAGAAEIAERLKIPPSAFLYVGDTAVDMKTAVRAGMQPVGAKWGFHPVDELLANGARAVIEAPLDILALLDGAVRPGRGAD